jgi:hypothetical protein
VLEVSPLYNVTLAMPENIHALPRAGSLRVTHRFYVMVACCPILKRFSMSVETQNLV